MKWRYGLVVPILALAYLAGANAVVNATRTSVPGTALSINASDGGALVAQSNQKWAAGAQQGKVLDLSAPGQKALRTAPLSGGALRLMGYGADLKGDARSAERLNLLATKVTQREKAAQLWLMEAAVARNDVKGALARYDVLLTTDLAVRDQLFPQLALALSDPEIRAAFIPYIRKAPGWLIPFVWSASGPSAAPDALSYAIREAGGLPKSNAARDAESNLLAQLFAKQKYSEALAFFGTLEGADIKATVSTAFDAIGANPRFAPATWQVMRGADIGAEFVGPEKAKELRVFALSGVSNLAAFKYLFLPANTYRFTSRHQVSSNGVNARANWTLRCMSIEGMPVIYQKEMIVSAKEFVPQQSFTVPQKCKVQRLDLNVSGGDDSSGLEMVISQAMIGQ